MIVPMKKVTVLCLDFDQAPAVAALQDMGLIHLEPLQTPAGQDLNATRSRRDAVATVQSILRLWLIPIAPPASASRAAPDGLSPMDGICRLDVEHREIKAQIEVTRTEFAKWEPFGYFDLQQFKALASSGVQIKLVFVPGKRLPVFPDSVSATLLKKTNEGVYAAVATLQQEPIEGKEFPLPSQSLREIETHLAQLTHRQTEIQTELHHLTCLLPHFDQRLKELDDQVQFQEACSGMKTEGRIACLRGYCPADALPSLTQTATTRGWAILAEDPQESDPVPTLVRNPTWIRPIRFLFQLIGVVPGYNEVDISAAFLGFYSLFFAMLVGDAGYGALFLMITLIIKFRVKAAGKDLIRLMLVLSGGTIVWGVLTGSYFGIANLPGPLSDLRIKWLSDERNLMQLCFLIGSIHLTLAHLWNLFRAWRKPALLAQVGWIGLVWTMYFMAGNMILDKVLPQFILPLSITSLVLVVLFMTPLKAMKTEWYNHIMLPLSVIGAFGDVVSYVRLFAVGSAGTAISMAFNQMAVGDGIHSFTSALTAALILFLAHTLNILLCALAVIVHGVRLNTLEFSSHLGMQWTGTPYAPLARSSATGPASGSVPV